VNRAPFRQQLAAVLCAFATVAATGAEPVVDSESPWVFSLLPKSLQAQPRLEATVVTEMTEAGRKLPPVTTASPAYYALQSGGFLRTASAPANRAMVSAEAIDVFVRRSLAARGYLPAEPEHDRRASLALVYAWGVHARLRPDENSSPQEMVQNVRTRAALVGGEKFAAQIVDLMMRASAQADAALPTARVTLDGEPVPPVLGPEQLEFISPIEQFRNASARNEALLEQVGNDVYFVILSAYDAAELARGHRVLLWRTRMTAATEGIAATDALPTLIKSASPYFGREMKDIAVLAPRSGSAGKVDYGPLEVKEWDAKMPAAEKK